MNTTSTKLAIFDIIRRKKVVATFRAEKGDDGNGVVHLKVDSQGNEQGIGFTGVRKDRSDDIIIGMARHCADMHLKVYFPSAKVVRRALIK